MQKCWGAEVVKAELVPSMLSLNTRTIEKGFFNDDDLHHASTHGEFKK
jgi:hypothetical protein